MNVSLPLSGKHLLLADDMDFVRDGTAAIVRQHGITVELCASGAELAQRLTAASSRFDAVVVDLGGMGVDFDPAEAIPILIQRYPSLPFIVFSSEDILARQLLDDGVQGYVLKIDGAQGLVGVLTKVLVERIVPSCSEHVRRDRLLGRREREVLQLIANGLIDKEIALRLDIKEHTVGDYRRQIFAKLDVRNATQAVAKGMRLRIIT